MGGVNATVEHDNLRGLIPRTRNTYLKVHGTYNLLSNCSYNPLIFRATVVIGLIFRLYLQLLSRL